MDKNQVVNQIIAAMDASIGAFEAKAQLSRLLRAAPRIRGLSDANVAGFVNEGRQSGIVINASKALAWLFERLHAVDSERANRLLAACGDVPWWIPGLWHLEVANALLVAERRQVLPRSEVVLRRHRSDHAYR